MIDSHRPLSLPEGPNTMPSNRTGFSTIAIAAALILSACNTADSTSTSGANNCEPSPGRPPALTRPDAAPPLVAGDGSYPVVPLEKPTITIKVIQSDAEKISFAGASSEVIQRNLDHMLAMGREACEQGPKPDFILYHEFPLTNYAYGNRDSKLMAAIEVPGSQTKALGELAKSCDSYIVFGAYAKDADWPGHILSLTTIIGRDGEVKKAVWKPRNIKRFYATFEITTTTVESVRERFREMYGAAEELPVLRTEFGNIAVSSAQLDPLIFAGYAMQGAEIVLRTSTLFFRSDIISTALSNNIYTAMANIPLDSPYGGQSMVVNPLGDVLAEVQGNANEGIAVAKIPIAAFRKNRRIPQYTTELMATIFSQYRQEIPMNHLDLPTDALPKTGEEMKTLFDQLSRWLNQP